MQHKIILIASFSTLSSQYHTSLLDIIEKQGLGNISFSEGQKTLLKEYWLTDVYLAEDF